MLNDRAAGASSQERAECACTTPHICAGSGCRVKHGVPEPEAPRRVDIVGLLLIAWAILFSVGGGVYAILSGAPK